MVKKRKDEQEFALTEPITLEETVSTTGLKSNLEEIKNYPGVIGYIMRNSASASIDLKDPTKIIDYAIVSSSALDAAKEISELFDLGDVKSIIIEGSNIKVLSLTIDENKVSIFMERNAENDEILRKLHHS
jgi:predicted regulator of Ras-like GTPase activity (Roadblock/LC7/MglB family)